MKKKNKSLKKFPKYTDRISHSLKVRFSENLKVRKFESKGLKVRLPSWTVFESKVVSNTIGLLMLLRAYKDELGCLRGIPTSYTQCEFQ